MKFTYITRALSLMIPALFVMASCSESRHEKEVKNLVINELMASNRTGLITEKGKAKDWIEIKNTSSDSIDLKGCILSVTRMRPDSLDDTTLVEETVDWEFPSIKIGGGQCLVLFADKSKKDKPEKEGVINLKFPKEGATIQLSSPNGNVISEVVYQELAPDQALALQPDSTYAPTYLQSPGFENTKEGYQAAIELFDSQRKDPLKIWEVMSRTKDPGFNWVELKNTGSAPIDLSAYSLGKKTGKTDTHQLPAITLEPGEFIVFQLAGQKATGKNELQLPFKLGSAETLILTKDGKFIDGVCTKEAPYGASTGRIDGKKGFFYFTTPTPKGENGESGKRFITQRPRFNQKPGVYNDRDSIVLMLQDTTRRVYYTLDGSEPTAASKVFKDSLKLSKSTVVRTFAEGDSLSLKSPITTYSYILGRDHQVPVLSVAVNHNDMHHPATGIYVNGPGYNPEWPHKGANFWKDWTKKAHMELFDDGEGISADCGLRIFGGFSRAEPKKSFRLKFLSEYGNSKVKYDFFGEGAPVELENLVVRSGSQDHNRAMIRDEFFTMLMREQSPTILTQSIRPVALYINGEYYGLYYLREKINKHFVSRKLNIPTDSINIIMSEGYNELGSKVPYQQLMSFVTSKDMKDPANYQYMKDNVDLLGLIDYKIGEIYSGNSDVGNIRYVRSTHPKSDKKWHFVFYDLDASWTGDKPAAPYYLSVNNSPYVNQQNKMIHGLLANPEFRALFLERLSHHLTHTFSKDNVNNVFSNLVNQINPEMEHNCKRWPQLSYQQWQKNIETFRGRFDDRPKTILNDIRDYLKVTDEENKKYFGHLGY